MSAETTRTITSSNLYSSQPSFTQTLSTSATTELTTRSVNSDQLLDSPIPGYSLRPGNSRVQADFDNDGQEDLLWRNYSSGQNLLWLMNGTTIATYAPLASVKDINWRIQGTGDFTGDGQIDILWRNYNTGQNVIWAMNPALEVSAISLASVKGSHWQIQGTGDITGDGQIDILWRNYNTGQNVVWAMSGTTLSTAVSLPDAPGDNLRIAATGDFNQDGWVDVLWRNYLSGDNLIWLMNGTTLSSVASLAPLLNLNWQIRAAGDYNDDGKLDITWRSATSGEGVVWLMNGLAFSTSVALPTVPSSNWQIAQQDVLPVSSSVIISNLAFGGEEGGRGTFQIQLRQAPTANVTVTFESNRFLTLDADNIIQNGTQTTITFTPNNWSQPQTIGFIAEVDDSSADRFMGNTVSYTLGGNLSSQGTIDLGHVANTYAPDPTRFNIDLDFRNDSLGFWTSERQAIAHQAANDWAAAIANEWNDFQLNSTLRRLDNSSARTYQFATQRYVDDVVVFVNNYQGSSNGEAALGGPDYEFGGWVNSPELMPRVGQIAINPAIFADQPAQILYDVVSHEIGHVLGLVGLNWVSFSLQDRAQAQTGTFNGAYATKANGGNPVPLQSQNGGDFAHPAAQVRSIMSYGWIYTLSRPSEIDFAMLADSGYRVYGVTDFPANSPNSTGNANTNPSPTEPTRPIPAAKSPEDSVLESTGVTLGDRLPVAAALNLSCQCLFCSALAGSFNLFVMLPNLF
ncbi:FG-GAP-like repeat-containing protein [Kovacikia minuta CCNUW1]|uniref:FG-GAP repeat domain-containing protein n=1 Tax=Kovacikia minuta TaxID=2931930 RepID=UPI001CC91721|nr:VCBS repeat-containing protein [Kovacikia minuta]UBF27746.1 FG-GAP-like repeat-containing protein [Kovacikia minuta CCNUW1]